MTQSVASIIVAALLLSPAAKNVRAAPPSLSMAEIAGQWRLRAKVAKNVRYELIGTRTIARGSYSSDPGAREYLPPEAVAPVPKDDHSFPIRITLTLDFEQGRIRRDFAGEIFYLSQARFVPDVESDFFDGREFRNLRPRDRNSSADFSPGTGEPDLRLLGKNVPSNFFRVNEVPILYAHGLVATDQTAPLTRESLLHERDVSHLSVDGERSLNGKRFVVVRESTPTAPRAHEWWIDPERSGAVVRAICYWKGEVAESLDVKYEKNDRGWFPRSWKMVSLEDGSPVETTQMTVKEIHFDAKLRDEDFTVEALPGMVVYDADTQHRFIKGAADSPDVPLRGLP